MKIRPMGAELHADGRTDMTKPVVAFRNFANAPKNVLFAFMCVWEHLRKADEDKFLI
jgi:hypothetical protein